MLKRQVAFFLLIFTLLFFSSPVAADTGASHRLAVMIVLDRINLEDLNGDYPNIRGLMDRGVAGLMNIRTARNYDPASSYLTLGAGTRAHAGGKGKKALMAFEAYETSDAGSAFEMYTGVTAAKSDIVQLDIPAIISENKKQDHEIIPGLLGELLKNNGIPVSILGNADTPLEKNRLAALIAMDTSGVVNSGYVGSDINKKDSKSPFFVKTDYEKLYAKFIELKAKGGLIVIHLGDTVRANDCINLVTPKMYEYHRKKALKDADEFIGRVAAALDLKKDLLMIVTPFPSHQGYSERKLLTPFIAAGPKMDPGLARSATTRRPGIISNIDIAPTVLDFFRIPVPAVMLGNPIESIDFSGAYNFLLDTNRKAVNTYIQRAYLIKPYVAMQIAVSIAFLLLIYFKKNWLAFAKPFILANMAVPLVFLVLPLLPGETLFYRYAWTFIISTAVASIGMRFKSTLGAITFISLLTASAITADLLSGARLLGTSVLGHDPIAGARYYGLGNEYEGVLIGSTTIGITAMLDEIKIKNRLTSLAVSLFVFGSVFYLISSPFFGSNVGGAISAYGAFLTTLLLLSGSRLNLKTFGGIGAGMALMLALLFFLATVVGPPSHISQTVALVKENGINPVFSIATRKLSMNYRLFKYTPWTRVLITTIAVIISLSFRPPDTMKKIFSRYQQLYAGFAGASIGCILGFIFNDSGIVAAGTMAIFLGLPVLLLIAEEITVHRQVD
ncbi:hypothetical protein [Thermosediminibacter oceani]|uniref:Alkaline phosphatase n=1 Tax=Thermosediminibacter oceani (strain ATCC BAA-1034 / DSM 16646 / JW/IW-1228P) TaxID=555079 RepID=D9RY44_THEOJ|nr:hypothetical protein [Thermosediminibacter oceani]ADL08268.1 conserved hypothetical protein [Thermosediminibacter oceani DSM 16646]